MELTSEVFVMVLFILGIPFFPAVLKGTRLPEYRLFILVYLLLTLSNIATVLEEFFFGYLFNLLEHLCITGAAISMCIAVVRLTSKKKFHPASRDCGERQ